MAQDTTAQSVIPKETLATIAVELGLSEAPKERPVGVFTRSEYEKAVGIGSTAAKKRLSKLVEKGVLETVETTIPRTGGGVMRIPGYRMVAKKAVPAPAPPSTEADGSNASGLGTA